MFADIAGFTAWSSVREPAQVFTLLEQIYGSFDALAKRRGVFKVETIGDCYGKKRVEDSDRHAISCQGSNCLIFLFLSTQYGSFSCCVRTATSPG